MVKIQANLHTFKDVWLLNGSSLSTSADILNLKEFLDNIVYTPQDSLLSVGTNIDRLTSTLLRPQMSKDIN